ncbi:MAG: lysylphosphatidylglycerol synthase transmembrane domain-containing protein [Candidatus Zixiibacteriota bacterium]
MKVFWKKKQFWGGLIAVALLAYCLKDIKLSEIRVLLTRVNYYYLIPAIVSSFVFLIFKGIRWKMLMSPQKKMATGWAISIYSAGQILNIVMPVLTGQVGRMILFARKECLKKTVVFSTIVLEVLFDAATLIIFVFFTSLAFVFPEEYRSLSYIISGVTVAVVAGLYLTLLNQQRLENMGRRHLRDRWPGLYISVKKFIRSFTKGMELLRSSQHIFRSVLISILCWTTHMLVIYFLIRSFGFELPLAASAVVMIINTVVLMVPITPGNAGTFEFAVSASLAAFSIGRSDAVLFSLALHLLDLLPIFTLGATFIHYDKTSLMEIKSRHEEEDLFDNISEDGTVIEEERV